MQNPWNTPAKVKRAIEKRNKRICVMPRCRNLPHGTWRNTCTKHFNIGYEWEAKLYLPE